MGIYEIGKLYGKFVQLFFFFLFIFYCFDIEAITDFVDSIDSKFHNLLSTILDLFHVFFDLHPSLQEQFSFCSFYCQIFFQLYAFYLWKLQNMFWILC